MSAAIITGVIVVCLLMVGLDGWRTWTARATEIANQKVGTANLARSLAQHAHDMLGRADTLLVSLRENVETDGSAPSERKHLQQLIAVQIATVPMMRDLMVFDREGYRVVNSGRPAPTVENILDRAYFQYHAAHRDRDVHVGPPVRGKLDGTWIITLSRRIDTAAGEFDGVVAGTFSLKAVREFYETFDVGKTGFIGLNTTEGVIVTRYPGDDSQAGRNISPNNVYKDRARTFATGDWQSVSPVDGVEHLGSFRTVESYPLFVAVGRGMDEVLAPWRTDALVHLAVTLAASAAIALLGTRLVRQLRSRHEVDLDLQRRERQFRLLADNNTDLIIQLDRDLRPLYASPASQGLLGFAPSEIVSSDLREFVHPEDWPAVYANLSAIARDGTAAPISYRARRHDGTDMWMELAGRRLGGGDDLIVIQRDITQRRNAEMQLRQAQRMEAVGQLTAGVAHDFNNLLQAQLGALELLLIDTSDQKKVGYFAAMALRAAQHAAKLTHSLLSFSRQQVLDPKAVAVSTLLLQLEIILSRTLGPRISLTIDIADDLDPIFADPAQVEAALLNLAINARDAMPDGGSLSIQASSARAALHCPEGLDRGRHVLIAVSDDGTGMSPEVLARACEPFYTTKGVGKGSGLGLSMVQGFAHQSKGALRFSSSLGHGTRAELWLPCAATEVAGSPADLDDRPSGQGRVLLVDDVWEVSLVMTQLLEDAGFSVVSVSTGETALQKLGAGDPFDAIVTDFAMPGIDGLELIRRARQSKQVLPAVIMTGHAASGALLDLPIDVVVMQKPVTGSELVGRLCDLIKARPRTARREPHRVHHASVEGVSAAAHL